MSFLKALFQTNKHKKLSEEWTQSREPVIDGVTFYVRYLGSSLVDDPKSAASTAAGVKRIIHAAKAGAKRPERVSLRVAMGGVRIDAVNRDYVLMDTSIYKISYCSADSKYDQVLAFVASNEDETCECHAFLCSKRKVAEAIAVSIAQAFTMAYECWKLAVETKRNCTKKSFSSDQVSTETGGSTPSRDDSKEGNTSSGSSPGHSPCHSSPSDMGSTSGYQSSTPGCLLLDFDDLTCGDSANGLNRVLPAPNRKHWVDFESGDAITSSMGNIYSTGDSPSLLSTNLPEIRTPTPSMSSRRSSCSSKSPMPTATLGVSPRNCSFNRRISVSSSRFSFSDGDQLLAGV